jgi:hypothetical protein
MLKNCQWEVNRPKSAVSGHKNGESADNILWIGIQILIEIFNRFYIIWFKLSELQRMLFWRVPVDYDYDVLNHEACSRICEQWTILVQ